MAKSPEGRRVALVTGSTSGIGQRIAERFAAGGIPVMLHGLEAHGADMAREWTERYGVPCLHDGANLLDPTAAQALIARCHAELGGVDILVNNAGMQYVAPIEEFPREKWDQIMALNLSAAHHLAQAAWPAMRAKGWGRIINIASVHGLRASPYKAAYVAAKHGLIGLTKVQALEGAPVGITANAICPGYVLTPLVEAQIADQARSHGMAAEDVVARVMLAKQAVKEFVPLDALAEMAWFLASDVAGTTTGTALPIDGGWTCQ